ncbi:MAG TPA: DUF4391 domain-containing protein [Candidatus Caccopulliclostridium gallistercoris]|uniref:DUF4391 domain-containing protein n=1 Tax=Candidatus Caccopulliclostridium gallistercoris TaxID=2840719 RepID=A0A9D1NF85_9FIRM|nr:DUF4391 domain-containing protein [Candidatus Caccopulliclostridium gallistercoris]
MFRFSEKTQVNIQFKMLELFRTIKADKVVKADAGNVTKVTLSNVLSPDRTNMESSDNVKEIYVFDIELNSNKIPEKFIEALNKSINFQTLLTLKYNEKVKYIIAVKIIDDEKIEILRTFESDWQEEELEDMPSSVKLENIYKQMIAKLTLYPFRIDEDFKQYVDRMSAIKKQKSEIEKQTKIMNAEKQPNIKMKLNDEIKQMKKELQELEV